MSIKLMTKVWENGPEDRTETMVLLALADRANDDGSSCFPSVAEVSQRSRLSRRGTQKVIRRLEDKGFLTVDENSGPGGTNNYQLHPARLEGRTECTGEGEPDSPGGERHSPGGEPDDAKGRTSFARNHQEPSSNRQENQSAPAREGATDAPVGIDRAVEIGQMIGVKEQLCREWWLYYDSRGWPHEVHSVKSALRKWKMNEKKFNGNSGDGASRSLPDSNENVIHFGNA